MPWRSPSSRSIRPAALQPGIAGANATIDLEVQAVANVNELFGSRQFLRGRYLDRAAGARGGIYANAKEEAVYFGYFVDATNQPLSGDGHRYTVTFAADALPPVNAFWSLTIYDATTQLLVANPVNRYLINSPMLPDLVRDADGGLTLYLQHDEPAADRQANWLPVPAGRSTPSFACTGRGKPSWTGHGRRRPCSPLPDTGTGPWARPAELRRKWSALAHDAGRPSFQTGQTAAFGGSAETLRCRAGGAIMAARRSADDRRPVTAASEEVSPRGVMIGFGFTIYNS